MYYRDEDPNRTGSPDDCFNNFMSDITGGRSDDVEDYEKRPIMPDAPIMPEMAQIKSDTDNFLRKHINQFARSSEQRDALLKQHGLEVE
jgi:hypothetical protein